MSDRRVRGMAASLVLILGVTAPAADDRAVPRWSTAEVVRPVDVREGAALGRPLALALDGLTLYVVDAQDCAIKAFSREGKFVGAFGRKGRGPGELSFPSGVSVGAGEIYIADKLNSRIQIFGRDGKPGGGFAVPFLPDKIHVLAADSLLVTGNPTGRKKGETLLHLFDAAGRPRWRGLEARSSSDPTFDAFRNMILVCPGDGGEFFVVFRSGERTVLRFGSTGALVGKIAIDSRQEFRPLDMPFKGKKKRLLGFCWAAAFGRGFLYLSAPERVDGPDLGPGREISVIDGEGRLRAVIGLPCPVHRFIVDGDRIFAIDDEGELRIFEVTR